MTVPINYETYNWTLVQEYYDLGYSAGKVQEVFGLSQKQWINANRRGKVISRRTMYSDKEIFCENSTYPRNTRVKEKVKEIFGELCKECGCGPTWNNKPITLELDHINGISNDHRIENLRLLCPNCHSQTDTYKAKNIKNINRVKKQAIRVASYADDPYTIVCEIKDEKGRWIPIT